MDVNKLEKPSPYIKVFERGREMLEFQGQPGNWDCDEYMHGLYNGMEFMLSLIEAREPKFRNAPNRFKKYEKNFNNKPLEVPDKGNLI